MRIFYPYNEILPKKAAHDHYIVQQCHHLATLGLQVTLLAGKGSCALSHYGLPKNSPLTIHKLPLIRKNNPLNISWNRPFFHLVQREIEKVHPDVVFLSVFKQGEYHLKRKKRGSFYIYEVHELAHYPSAKGPFEREKKMLEKADLITVTTDPLAQILRSPPYSLKNPIVTIPLAVNAKPLPPAPSTSPFTVAYVGQLYKGQGVELLIEAAKQVPHLHLHIFGGKKEEITALSKLADPLAQRITFFGHLPQHKLFAHLQKVHAFVAPFEATGRMPYVAHTKLLEYEAWGRPFIAPNLSIVKEHHKEALLFEPGSVPSLANALKQVATLPSPTSPPPFTWQQRVTKLQSLLF